MLSEKGQGSFSEQTVWSPERKMQDEQFDNIPFTRTQLNFTFLWDEPTPPPSLVY